MVQAELNKIHKRLGDEAFPLIPQSYYSSFQGMMYGKCFPAVVKASVHCLTSFVDFELIMGIRSGMHMLEQVR